MSELTDGAFSREALQGEWIGEVELPHQLHFVRLELLPATNEPGGTLDLPDHFARHRVVAVHHEAEHIAFDVQARDQLWRFTGEQDAARLSGTCNLADEQGTFSLQHVVALDPDLYRPYVGTYRLNGDRQVMLGLSCDPSFPPLLYFYQEGDRLIRLYPLSTTHLISERGESVTLGASVSPATPTLTWQHGSTPQVTTLRILTHREEEVQIPSGEVTLAGTLLLPLTGTPCPAVVLVHGSFPRLRDYYRVYAQPFVQQGIAALIYDQRGSGASSGTSESSIADRTEDAQAAVTSLQTHQDIDPQRVGIWGLSNGTWSLPQVAARLQDRLAFLIAVGAAGVTMARAEVYRKRCELQEWGIPEALLQQVDRVWSIIYAYAATGQWDERWDDEFEPLARTLQAEERLQHLPLPPYAREHPLLSPLPPQLSAQQLKEDYGGRAPDLAYDPIRDYERVRCPVLFLMGAQDRNLPVQEGVSRVEQALQRGSSPYTIKVFPHTGHAMNVVDRAYEGLTEGEATHLLYQYRLAPGFLDLMSNWVGEQVWQPPAGKASTGE